MAEDRPSCEICGGFGCYPIHDQRGKERYSINCPECYGSGAAEVAPTTEPAEWPPSSSAAAMRTADDMREFVQRHWSERS